VRATIVFNRRLSPAYRHLGLAAPGFPQVFQAGQFAMVRPVGGGDPFLPRAFSIYRITASPEPVVEILYKVLGKGTQYLAQMEQGQAVEILGLLGNAFLPPPPGARTVLVAGGIGVPPIAALAGQIRNSKFEIRNLEVFLGGKTSEDILCVKDFEEAGAGLQVTTEDGSLGTRGLITDLLEPFLLRAGTSALTLYTCGPPGMLAAVARLAAIHKVPCQVSMEANMACGFGACMGCAIEVAAPDRRYKLVCKDGPVFDSREIKW
jgi:dihydroorotate dehydrogenase electron transfer subunit